MESKKIYHIIAILLLFQILSPVWSQQDSLTVAIDSSNISAIHFTDELSKKYTGNEFDYNTVEGETENLLVRALNWFFNGIQSIFGVTIDPQLALLIKYIIYILLLGIAIYIVVRVLMGKDAVSFFRKKDNLVAPIPINEEHIEKINLDELITDALREKNYRLAIRYMYLKTLQDLSLKKIIEYHFEKTNIDYYREIADVTIKQNFNKVSYLYDYIWYGKFELDKNGYLKAKESFDVLNAKMRNIG